MKPLLVVLYYYYNTTDLLTFLTQISVFDIFVFSSRTRPNVDFFGFQMLIGQCCKPIRDRSVISKTGLYSNPESLDYASLRVYEVEMTILS